MPIKTSNQMTFKEFQATKNKNVPRTGKRGNLRALKLHLALPWETCRKEIYDFAATSEDHMQAMFVKFVRERKPEILMFNIPNGSKKSLAGAYLFKATGLMAGVADLFVAHPTDKWGGLFIELKHGRNKQTPVQVQFGADIRKAGYQYVVCTSLSGCEEQLFDYLSGEI